MFTLISGMLVVALALPMFISGCDTDDVDCTLCGSEYEVSVGCSCDDESDEHGMDRCIRVAPCNKAEHYVIYAPYTDENKVVHTWVRDRDGVLHTECKFCGEYLCDKEPHGSGICDDSDPDPSPSATPQVPATTPSDATPTPENSPSGTPAGGKAKSSDCTLRVFTVTFPNGTTVDMRDV